MSKHNYTKTEIDWAMAELKRKRPRTEPKEEQAIKLLDTFSKFKGMIAEKVGKDTKTSNKNEIN